MKISLAISRSTPGAPNEAKTRLRDGGSILYPIGGDRARRRKAFERFRKPVQLYAKTKKNENDISQIQIEDASSHG